MRKRGTVYEAAKSKHPLWKLAWNTVSREHQFQKEFSSETPLPTSMQQPLVNAAPESEISVDSFISELQSNSGITTGITLNQPSCIDQSISIGLPLQEQVSKVGICITNG